MAAEAGGARGAGLGSCLDENQAALLVTRAAGDDAERWRQHAEACESCRVFVGGLARVLVVEESASVGGWRNADAALPVGAQVGKYVVGKILGRGGMGCVYAARDEDLDREVALKLLHLGGDSDRAIARLRREAAVMAALSHPNVAAVFDYGKSPSGAYVAMERIEGEDLRRWLQTPHTTAEIIDAFGQAGRGLEAAHAAGVVHRDFKPSNAMMGRDGRVRVLDFGLALEMGPESKEQTGEHREGEDGGGDASSLTHGGVVGTPAYAAPEQLEGVAPTVSADQFAFCVALCEGLLGERPFAARTSAERAALVAAQVLPAELRQQPRAIRRVLQRGLREHPRDRFASMGALLKALSNNRSPGTRMWSLLGAAVAMLVLAAVGVSASSAPPCDDGVAQLQARWDAARSQRWAGDVHKASLVPRLDAAASAWLDVRATACAMRSENSSLFEHRAVCLERAAARIGTVVDRIERTREAGLTLPSSPLAHLPTANDCLEPGVPSPQRSALAAEYETLNAKLSDLEFRGEYEAQEVAPLRLEAEALRVRAAAIGDVSLQAALTRKLGVFFMLELRLGEAERYFQEAYLLASLADDNLGKLQLAETMVLLFSQYLRDLERTAYWTERAQEAANAEGGDEAQARALMVQGLAALALGRLAEAVDTLDQVEALVDPKTFDRLETLLLRRGEAKFRLGDTAGATADYERSLHLTEARLGPESPALGNALNTLATVAMEGGDFDTGEALLTRAIAIAPAAQAMDIALMRGNLGVLYTKTQRYARALKTFEEVRGSLDAILGSEHPQTLRTEVDIAETLLALERHTESLAVFDRLLAGKLGEMRAQVLYGRANVHDALGDARQARADLEDIVALEGVTDVYRDGALAALAELDGRNVPPSQP